jgi:hypothetical protein
MTAHVNASRSDDGDAGREYVVPEIERKSPVLDSLLSPSQQKIAERD